MAAKAETKDVAKEPATPAKDEKKAEEVKPEDKPAGENGDVEMKEVKAEGEEKAEEEPKPFKYKDSYNATAEEHEQSPYLWIRSKNLLQAVTEDVEKTQAAMKEVFTDKFEVSLPKLKLPLLMHLYVRMNDIEEKRKVMAGTHRPDKWKRPAARPMPDVVTQSVVIREERYDDATPGTLEEALDVILPHRKIVYKEQLALKTKDLDETLDQVVKLTNESIAKDRKNQKPVTVEKPAMENIVPMVPNVGYDRNVALDLKKDSTGKISVGIRVVYEKDEAKKIFFVPVSECTHISPEIIKAAEAVAEHLSKEKFDVFDGVNISKDLYGLKFSMNDVGEIVMSVVLVIDDKFVDEFYDLSDKDKLSPEVVEYFARVGKSKPKGKDKPKPEGEAEAAGGEEAEGGDEAEVDEADVTANGEGEAEAETSVTNGDEKKEEITIMRESAMKPISLEKSPFLNRVNSQIRDHLTRFCPSLKKFFEEKCSGLGVSGIYITWHATNNRPSEWNRNVKHWYHVCGSQSVSETISSVKLDLYPHLESYHPSRTQVIPTLMNLLVDNLGIDSNSQIVVACDYYFVQSFFAQKCKKVMMMTFMNEMLRNDIKAKFKDSISFLSAKAKQVNIVEKCKRYFGEYPHSVIHWGQYQDMPIKRLFQHRVKKVAVVYDPRDKTLKKQANNLDVLKKMNIMLHPYYTLKKVVGVDVCPQRNGPPSVIAFYDAVAGHIPFNQRGQKRRNQFQAGGPGAKRQQQQQGGRPNQGAGGGGRQNHGPNQGGNRNANNANNKRRGGGMGGGQGGGRGGYFQKRSRMDDRSQGPMARGPGGGGGPRGGRFNQRSQPMGRQPNPWGQNRDNYGDRQNYGDERPAEHTVQAAKAVLSQLNSIIENQLLLANINQGGGGGGGGGGRNRSNEDWGRPAPRGDSFGGPGRGGSGLGGPPAYGNEPADYFSRDRSPPNLNLSGSFRPSDFGGAGRNRDFGGNRSGGGLGGPSGGNRRGGGGGRSNFSRR